MRRGFPRHSYGQLWQIESAISRHKRRMGSSLRAPSWAGQQREVYLRVLVHNLMILLRAWQGLFNRAGTSQSELGLQGRVLYGMLVRLPTAVER